MDMTGAMGTRLYLDLLKRTLTRSAFPDRFHRFRRSALRRNPLASLFYPVVEKTLDAFNLALCRTRFDPGKRMEGRDWPAEAETMIGMKRLDNLEQCIRSVLERDVPGDFIETGVWRGGSCILMRAVLKAFGDDNRIVWAADSFEGIPSPDPRYPLDGGSTFHEYSDILGVSLEQVQENFRRYGMLDDQVRFLKGLFKDTLPTAPIRELAILRLDGDLYSSTIDALTSLYPKLSPGGFVIVDDYGDLQGCRQAVTDYREKHGICEPIVKIDWTGVFWEKR
jgi:O-methyltransferase